MKTKKLMIKKESVIEFFTNNMVESENERVSAKNPYTFLNGPIYCKRNLIGTDRAEVRMMDIASESKSILTNVYTYKIEQHDDVSDKWTLIDFNIEIE